MQYFDEDMGELFQKASADIRLRPADDDWEKIQAGLLSDRSLSPSKETKDFSRKKDRVLKPVLFIFVITAITLAIPVNQNSQKMETVLQPVIRQVGGNLKGPVIENDKMGQNKKAGSNFRFLIPVIAENTFAEDQLKIRRLIELAPPRWEGRIQVGFNEESEPSIRVFDISQDSGYKQVMPQYTDGQKNAGAEKWLYAGIIAGPQFNETKQQGFGNAGVSGGLIAGFHLNKRLSVETGLVISDKQYYSAGKYFDMTKISASMPAGMKLMQIHSKTTVLEIPLEIRYNVATISKGNLFAACGFSSYIITREINQYQATVNGNDETLNGNYSTHQDYFAAAAKISAGYEFNAVKGLNLRLEPYLQIPLKTIGMGSMHVFSTGVYLGITFPIIK